jgi:hypothetical protein
MNFSFHSAFKRFLQFVCLGTLALMSSVASAQSGGTFVSGSTGADGALSPAAGAPGTTTTVTLPARTYHFTTITIPSGVTVQFTRSPGNPPVVLLATGDVRIEGRISVAGTNGNSNGVGGTGGPGGFNGGNGAFGMQTTRGASGEGPGGGAGGFSVTPTAGSWAGVGGGFATSGSASSSSSLSASRTYGTPSLQPLIGGSGGGGGGLPIPAGSAPSLIETGGPGGLPYISQSTTGGGGGGGGGAIVIASSASIILGGNQGEIDASGGSGSFGGNSQHGQGGGGGAGGGVRLVANAIVRSATGNNSIIRIGGGASFFPGGGAYATGRGGVGFIRFDAFTVSGTFFVSPNDVPIAYGRPTPVLPENAPQLRIASIGGVATPANPAASFQFAPDVTLPAAQGNPVTITVVGSGIPVGTVVTLLISSESGAQTRLVMPALSGSDANSTTSAQATLPNGMSVIYASATVGLIGAQPTAVNGDVIEKKEYLAGLGGATQVRYVGRSGRVYTEREFSAAAPVAESGR